MKYNSLSYSPLFEKTLVRVISEFNSDMSPTAVLSSLSKALKRKVSKEVAGSYNINITRGDDGVWKIETAFMTYRDSRLTCLNLFGWLEKNGSTEKDHNMFVDIKFLDSEEGPFKGTLFFKGVTVEKIDKLKFILEFNEDLAYKAFPSRRYGFNTKSIKKFDINQKFIPKEESVVDPKFYAVPNTEECGINFECLNDGFLRMQYIGGKDYHKRPSEVLDLISEFCVISWNSTFRPTYSKENILEFEKIILKQNKIRECYLDYAIFKQKFDKVRFSVDLIEDPKTLEYYYSVLRDRIYDFLIDTKFKDNYMELNYDTSISALQVREAEIKSSGTIKDVEFVNCKIQYGNFVGCTFYDCEITDCRIIECNLYLDSILNRCRLINSMANRTVEINSSDIDGVNSVLNGKMNGGIFRKGKLGVYAELNKEVIVIEYEKLKPGYFVAGDTVIIPTKKYLKP